MVSFCYTVNPQISPGGLKFAKENFWWGLSLEEGLFEGRGLFQSLVFSSKVDIKSNIIFSIN